MFAALLVDAVRIIIIILYHYNNFFFDLRAALTFEALLVDTELLEVCQLVPVLLQQ